MDNVDRMMYVGEVPWHKKGTQLQNVATSAEAIEAAGLTWEVEKRQVLYTAGKTSINTKPYLGKFVTVRKDNEVALGIVGNIYRPLQNKEAFSFFDAIVGVKEAMYHTAGSLGKGERVWILAKLPGCIKVTNEDVVDKYLLLSNSHDGSSAVEMMFTPIRVVCQNTLNMAMEDAVQSQRVAMRHTLSLGMKIEDTRKKLGIVKYQYQIFEELSQKMLNIQMNQESFTAYLEKIGIITRDEEGKLSGRSENNLQTLTSLFEHGKGNDLPRVAGSAWAAVNAVVEYTDYIRGTDENRTKSILYGSGGRHKAEGVG